jgi:hypothetical protein
MSRCKPGDLAVVISAANEANLGRIVKVIELHHGKGPMAMVRDCPVWMVECSNTMTWTDGPKVYQLNRGPVPDLQLQPIRGRWVPKRVTIIVRPMEAV